MTKYEITETTPDGKRIKSRNELDADSFDDAVKKYFQSHSDPESIRGLDVQKQYGAKEWYNLSDLRVVNMSD